MTIVKKFDSDRFIGKKIVVGLAFIVISITVLEIWVVNRVSTYGIQIIQLEQTKSALILQNQVLGNQIAQIASLKNMEDISRNLGFEHTKNIQYLQTAGLALNY